MTTPNNTNAPLSGSVTFSGQPAQGETLTASHSLVDPDGLGEIGYQWLRDGVAIDNATDSSYTLIAEDVGRHISVQASYIDGFGQSESAVSPATVVVARITATVTGTDGDDVLSGSTGNDYIIGGLGNDSLDGGAGDDYLDGGEGDDSLDGGSGNDYLYGGAGADNYIFGEGAGRDVIFGASGNEAQDVVFLDAGITPADLLLSRPQGSNDLRLSLSSGSDSLTLQYYFADRNNLKLVFDDGTEWDYAAIGAMPVSVQASSSDDFFYGAINPETIDGQAGNDQLYGNDGNDTLSGGEGDDILNGGGGDDVLTGQQGNDYLGSGAGIDSLDGGEGDDYLDGGEDDDHLDGGAGDDYLVGGDGADTYIFDVGAGHDTIYGAGDSAARDTVRFGADIAPADLSLSHPIGTQDLRLSLPNGNDSLTLQYYFSGLNNLELVFDDGTVWDYTAISAMPITSEGTPGDDIFHGSANPDIVRGLDGNDTLHGGAGDDDLIGGDGDDYLFGGDGNDWLDGGAGNDLMDGGGGSYTTFIYRSGQDTLAGGGSVNFYAPISPEHISLSRVIGSDDLKLSLAGSSSDSLTLQAYFKGSSNYDFSFLGTDGTHWTRYEFNSKVVTVEGTSGDDYYYGAYHPEIVNGGQGNDSLHGGDGDDILNGGQGNDWLGGDSGNDILNGGEGDDSLSGSWGDDILIGGDGNDILVGDEGNDYLSGGAGADTYYIGLLSGPFFERPWGHDTILSATGDEAPDTIRFANDASPADFSLSRPLDSNDLQLSWSGGRSTVTLQSYFAAGTAPAHDNLTLVFPDDTIWNSATLDAMPLNDAPTAAGQRFTIGEDQPRVLTAADFGFADTNDGDQLQAVVISRLPTAGSLRLDNAVVWVDQFIQVADIVAGKLVFTPAANTHGSNHSSFDFKVSDGKTISASTYVMMVDVEAINDAPAGAVYLSGTVVAPGQTLTASHTLADPDGLGAISYQWLRDDESIDGATADTYTLTQADAGRAISVRASYTDFDGTLESVTSAATNGETLVNTAPSFGASLPRTGQLSVAVGSSWDTAYATTLQPDGKLVVAGGSGGDFGLIRLNADGMLDSSFSGNGLATFDFASEGQVSAKAYSVSVQSDGKILVAGETRANNGASDFGLIRLHADGTLDASFADDGKVTFSFGVHDAAHSLALQPDGKILVAGVHDNDNYRADSTGDDFGVIRLNADGTLDSSFGDEGKLSVDVGSLSDDVGRSMTLQPDGKILVAGSSGYDFGVIRLNADGTLDSDFSDDGKLTVDIDNGSFDGATSLALQPDGKILVAGYGSGGTLIRLNTDGTLDSGFGDGGLVVDLSFRADALALQPDGKIVVLGSVFTSGGGGYLSVIRLNDDGTLDTSFSGDGEASIEGMSLSYWPSFNGSLTLQPDGKIVVASGSLNSAGLSDFSVIRLNGDGTLDTSFGSLDDGAPSSGGSTLGGTVDYVENATPVLLDADVAIVDSELAALDGGAGNYSGATLTLARTGGASGDDLFSGLGNLVFSEGEVLLSGVTLGSVTLGGGSLSITFKDNATQANVDQVLRSIGYVNASDTPPASVELEWTFRDGTANSALSVTDSTTVLIQAVNDAPTGSVTVTGTVAQGQTLTASHTLADLDGLGAVSYQWLADGQAISGATGSTLLLGQDLVGKAVSVQASYTDGFGTVESETSASFTVAEATFITGTPQVDTLYGNAGDNTLDGGEGIDSMAGGLGDDRYLVDLNANGMLQDKVTEGLNAGSDTLVLRGSSSNAKAVTLTLGANIEHLDASQTGASLLNLTGNALANELTGNAAGNLLNGAAGDDILRGGAGDDILIGGAGADTLDGEEGSDIYVMSLATDHAAGERIADSGSEGTDQIRLAGGSGTLTLSSSISGIEEVVIGTGTGATAVSTGTAALNVDASAVDNRLTLSGNNGANILTGTAYDDLLIGNGGNDTLIGGGGSDVLTGGAGADKFVFDSALQSENVDTITDFTSRIDKIVLDDDVFTALGITGMATGVALTTNKFYAGARAETEDHRLIYDQITGGLYYDADGSGSEGMVKIALIGAGQAHPTLVAADFLIIA